jgi:hypothetical protein
LPFACNEIVYVCKQLNNGKTVGPDYMLSEFFKYGIYSDKFLSVLCTLFNSLLLKGHFPDSWSDGWIVPLHKQGEKDNVNN